MPAVSVLEAPLYILLTVQIISLGIYFLALQANEQQANRRVWLPLWQMHARHLVLGFWPTILLILLQLFGFPITLRVALLALLLTGFFYMLSALWATYQHIFAKTAFPVLVTGALDLSQVELLEGEALLSIGLTMSLIIVFPGNAMIALILNVVVITFLASLVALVIVRLRARKGHEREGQTANKLDLFGKGPDSCALTIRLMVLVGPVQNMVLTYVDVHSYGWLQLFLFQMALITLLAALTLVALRQYWEHRRAAL